MTKQSPPSFEQALSLGVDDGLLPAHNHAHGVRIGSWRRRERGSPRAGTWGHNYRRTIFLLRGTAGW